MENIKQDEYKTGDSFCRIAYIDKITEFQGLNKTYYTIRYKDTKEAVTYQKNIIDLFERETNNNDNLIKEAEKTIDNLTKKVEKNKPHNLLENKEDLPYDGDYCIFYVKITDTMTMAHIGIFSKNKFRENNLYGKEYEPNKEVVFWKNIDRFIALTETE